MKRTFIGSRTARLACLLAAVLVVVEVSRGGVEDGHQIEKGVMAYTASDAFRALRTDRGCHDQSAYHVYLIDNFELGSLFSEFITEEPTQSYVWLNAPHRGAVFSFDPVCRVRGTVSGTSVIPPHKVKDLLPPKTVGASKDPARSAAAAGG